MLLCAVAVPSSFVYFKANDASRMVEPATKMGGTPGLGHWSYNIQIQSFNPQEFRRHPEFWRATPFWKSWEKALVIAEAVHLSLDDVDYVENDTSSGSGDWIPKLALRTRRTESELTSLLEQAKQIADPKFVRELQWMDVHANFIGGSNLYWSRRGIEAGGRFFAKYEWFPIVKSWLDDTNATSIDSSGGNAIVLERWSREQSKIKWIVLSPSAHSIDWHWDRSPAVPDAKLIHRERFPDRLEMEWELPPQR